MTEIKKFLHDRVDEQWQSSWDNDRNGRVTYSFIRDVKRVRELRGINVTWQVGSLITGHGQMNSYLKQIKSRTSALCDCGVDVEDSDHMVRFCDNYDDLRVKLGELLGVEVDADFPLEALLASREFFGHFVHFAGQIIDRRLQIIAMEG